MQPFVKYKMDKQRWALLYLLPIWMMAGGGMGAVRNVTEDHRWVVTEWSQCSASCGGVRVRSVYCVNNYRLVSDGCQSEKPSSLVLCNLDKCQKPGLHLWLRSTRRKETSTVSSKTTQTNAMASSIELQSVKQASTGLLDWTVSEWSE
ncbi:A disintegrin and metalloproteinase with thrombospondin motifs 7, partial [Geodia barretti]